MGEFGALFVLITGIVNLCILVYVLWLFSRLVQAVEHIASTSELGTRMLHAMLDKLTGKDEKHGAAD